MALQDILRIESFGAMHYSRRTAKFVAVPPKQADLLLAAASGELLDAWAATPPASRVSREELMRLIAEWQAIGMIGEDLRAPARVVDKQSPMGVLNGPLVTHLQLTHACNLRCTHCYVDITAKPAPDELTTREVAALFAELEEVGSPVVVMAGGEPMVRADLFEIIEEARARGIDAWLCTNATLLREDTAKRLAQAGLRGISVSLDGADARTHDELRGLGRFDAACRGIRWLVRAGYEHLDVRVTVTATNAHKLLGFAPLAQELGVARVVMKPFRQTGAAAGQHGLFIDHAAYRRAIDAVRAFWPEDGVPLETSDGIPNRTPEWTRIIPRFGCVGGTTSATVTAKGAVVACGSVLDPMDWSLREHSFRECWYRAPSLASWRDLGGNDDCASCGNYQSCGGGCRARALAAGRTIREPDPWSYCSTGGEIKPSRLRVL